MFQRENRQLIKEDYQKASFLFKEAPDKSDIIDTQSVSKQEVNTVSLSLSDQYQSEKLEGEKRFQNRKIQEKMDIIINPKKFDSNNNPWGKNSDFSKVKAQAWKQSINEALTILKGKNSLIDEKLLSFILMWESNGNEKASTNSKFNTAEVARGGFQIQKATEIDAKKQLKNLNVSNVKSLDPHNINDSAKLMVGYLNWLESNFDINNKAELVAAYSRGPGGWQEAEHMSESYQKEGIWYVSAFLKSDPDTAKKIENSYKFDNITKLPKRSLEQLKLSNNLERSHQILITEAFPTTISNVSSNPDYLETEDVKTQMKAERNKDIDKINVLDSLDLNKIQDLLSKIAISKDAFLNMSESELFVRLRELPKDQLKRYEGLSEWLDKMTRFQNLDSFQALEAAEANEHFIRQINNEFEEKIGRTQTAQDRENRAKDSRSLLVDWFNRIRARGKGKEVYQLENIRDKIFPILVDTLGECARRNSESHPNNPDLAYQSTIEEVTGIYQSANLGIIDVTNAYVNPQEPVVATILDRAGINYDKKATSVALSGLNSFLYIAFSADLKRENVKKFCAESRKIGNIPPLPKEQASLALSMHSSQGAGAELKDYLSKSGIEVSSADEVKRLLAKKQVTEEMIDKMNPEDLRQIVLLSQDKQRFTELKNGIELPMQFKNDFSFEDYPSWMQAVLTIGSIYAGWKLISKHPWKGGGVILALAGTMAYSGKTEITELLKSGINSFIGEADSISLGSEELDNIYKDTKSIAAMAVVAKRPVNDIKDSLQNFVGKKGFDSGELNKFANSTESSPIASPFRESLNALKNSDNESKQAKYRYLENLGVNDSSYYQGLETTLKNLGEIRRNKINNDLIEHKGSTQDLVKLGYEELNSLNYSSWSEVLSYVSANNIDTDKGISDYWVDTSRLIEQGWEKGKESLRFDSNGDGVYDRYFFDTETSWLKSPKGSFQMMWEQGKVTLFAKEVGKPIIYDNIDEAFDYLGISANDVWETKQEYTFDSPEQTAVFKKYQEQVRGIGNIFINVMNNAEGDFDMEHAISLSRAITESTIQDLYLSMQAPDAKQTEIISAYNDNVIKAIEQVIGSKYLDQKEFNKIKELKNPAEQMDALYKYVIEEDYWFYEGDLTNLSADQSNKIIDDLKSRFGQTPWEKESVENFYDKLKIALNRENILAPNNIDLNNFQIDPLGRNNINAAGQEFGQAVFMYKEFLTTAKSEIDSNKKEAYKNYLEATIAKNFSESFTSLQIKDTRKELEYYQDWLVSNDGVNSINEFANNQNKLRENANLNSLNQKSTTEIANKLIDDIDNSENFKESKLSCLNYLRSLANTEEVQKDKTLQDKLKSIFDKVLSTKEKTAEEKEANSVEKAKIINSFLDNDNLLNEEQKQEFRNSISNASIDLTTKYIEKIKKLSSGETAIRYIKETGDKINEVFNNYEDIPENIDFEKSVIKDLISNIDTKSLGVTLSRMRRLLETEMQNSPEKKKVIQMLLTKKIAEELYNPSRQNTQEMYEDIMQNANTTESTKDLEKQYNIAKRQIEISEAITALGRIPDVQKNFIRQLAYANLDTSEIKSILLEHKNPLSETVIPSFLEEKDMAEIKDKIINKILDNNKINPNIS